MIRIALAVCFGFTACVSAQRGDKPGEPQPPPPKEWHIPNAPPLSPEEARDAFVIAPGFRVELVAAEPLVEDPVAMTFDARGRLWVVEMRDYMPNVDGTGEEASNGSIAVLEDTDGDGRMDRRHVFADGLLLPRALALHRDGALFIEPPYLRLFRDVDGDLEWDEDEIVSYGFGGRINVEQAPNGLVRGIDNWIYLANHPGRIRLLGNRWVQEPVGGGGQWGIAQDDVGRLFFNVNTDHLRGHLIPPHYAVRNPALGTAWGTNLRIARDQAVWPVRVTPGVNRGYRKGILHPSGTLARFTAACGPTIYRGDAYPQDFRGNAFVCEPAGNLVKRDILGQEPKTGLLTARHAYKGSEFLASTDERFRPVNLRTGPDGCLYVCDMYRGILQHRLFVTSYLRKQILKRGLQRPVGLGRIWRIVPEDFQRPKPPRLDEMPSQELVRMLSHENGWWRDTAQRLLIERNDQAVVPPLRELARDKTTVVPRLHALWTLDGLSAMDAQTVLMALDAEALPIRSAGFRLAEALLRTAPYPNLRARFLAGSSVRPKRAQTVAHHVQVLFSLGALGTEEADQAMARLLLSADLDRPLRDAATSGLWQRELAFLERLLDDAPWRTRARGRPEFFTQLAACITRGQDASRIRQLLERTTSCEVAWQQDALLAGVVSTRPAKNRRPRPLRLDQEPAELVRLKTHERARTRTLVTRLLTFTTWPGKADWEQLRLRPLSSKERALFDRGRQFYSLLCQGCHQQNGRGQDGLAPPLMDSEWVTGPPERLARILRHGLSGPVTVKGKLWDLQMPGLHLAADEIAAILTYVRRTFRNEADPVLVDDVETYLRAMGTRKTAWTEAELMGIGKKGK